MTKLKGLPSLIVIVTVVWLAMRAIHVLLPIIQPEVLTGPFVLESLSEAQAITGFSPPIPLYHPEALGIEPVTILAERRPEAQVTIVWRDQNFLELVERPAGSPPFSVPEDAELIEDRQVHLWSRGDIVHAAGNVKGVQLSLRTDLTREDAMRVVSTLLPLEEVK